MDRNYTIDVTIIPYKGKLRIRRYIPNNLTKYGIKLYAIADSETGYLRKLYVYYGRHDKKNIDNRVLALLNKLPYKSHIFMDSHFTNIPLLHKMQNMGYNFTCSIQRNKKGLPKKEENSKLASNSVKVYRSGNFL